VLKKIKELIYIGNQAHNLRGWICWEEGLDMLCCALVANALSHCGGMIPYDGTMVHIDPRVCITTGSRGMCSPPMALMSILKSMSCICVVMHDCDLFSPVENVLVHGHFYFHLIECRMLLPAA
jgi:hypothetical protein